MAAQASELSLKRTELGKAENSQLSMEDSMEKSNQVKLPWCVPHASDTKQHWSLQGNSGDGFDCKASFQVPSCNCSCIFPLLTVGRWSVCKPKPSGSSSKGGGVGGGGPHAYSDARSRTVFAVCCGLTQQFSPAQLFFYTIPFFIPFTVDGGL